MIKKLIAAIIILGVSTTMFAAIDCKNTVAGQLVGSFMKNYKERNLDEILSLFADDMEVWGTEESQVYTSKNSFINLLNMDWSTFEKLEVKKYYPMHCSSDGTWAAQRMDIKVWVKGRPFFLGNMRVSLGTSVKNKDGKAKIMFMGFALPEPDYS